MFPALTHDDVFRIETARLWLRWPMQADAQTIAAFAGRPEVARMTATWNIGVSVAEVRRRIDQSRQLNRAGRALRLVIALKERPANAIGQLGVDAMAGGRLGLGYHLAPEFWNRGLMSEAVAALVDHSFYLTPVEHIQAQVRLCNPASAKVLTKCGFKSAGVEWSDTLVHGQIAKERYVIERSGQPLLVLV